MNFVVGGIKGIVNTVSFTQKQPPESVLNRIELPEHDECVHDFNCALDGSIILQGNLYLFNTAMCFHSVFNKKSIVGSEKNDTLIFMPFNQIISINKTKKAIFFDNSMQVKTLSGIITLISFVKRDSAFDIIDSYRKAFYNLLPSPLHDFNDFQGHIHNPLNNSDHRGNHQQNQIKNSSALRLQPPPSQQQQQQINLDSIDNEEDWLMQVNAQFARLEQQQVEQQNKSQQLQVEQQQKQQQQQQVADKQSKIQLEVESIPLMKVHNPPPQLPLGIPHDILVKMEEEAESELEKNPLEMQRSALRDFDNYAHVYAPLFDERAQRIKRSLSNEYNMHINDLKELIIENMSVREVFSIFFSNVQFQRNAGGALFSCFMEFYLQEYLHAQNLRISQITPNPPEIFNSVYSSNYSELLEFPLHSTRTLTFDHPIPNPSFFMPKSLHCSIQEKHFWCSPHEFILTRNITLTGASICKSFEPRVIFMVSQANSNVVIRAGFKVHFNSSSLLKKIIENGAKDENEKTWNEMKNVISNVAREYAQKRDSNKRVEQNVNQNSFVRPDQIAYDVYDADTNPDEENDFDEAIQNSNHMYNFEHNKPEAHQPIESISKEEKNKQSRIRNEQEVQAKRALEQQSLEEEEKKKKQSQNEQNVREGQDKQMSQQYANSLNQIAEKASKEACHIF